MIYLILAMFTSSSFAMYGHTVPNYERLHVNQKCHSWCWAATAEAIHNYVDPSNTKKQEDIAYNNPAAPQYDKCVPFVESLRYENYLTSVVLNTDTIKSQVIENIGDSDFELIKHKINNNLPMITFYDFHARIIYGYFYLKEELYFQLFNPAAFMFYSNPWENISVSELRLRKFLPSAPINQVHIVYLSLKKE